MNMTEFLIAAIMQSQNCAKYLRMCTIFGLMNAKQEKLALISVFVLIWQSFFSSSFTCLYIGFFLWNDITQFSIRSF